MESGTARISNGSLRFSGRDLSGPQESYWYLDKIAELQVSIEIEKNAEGTMNWLQYRDIQLDASNPPLGKSPRTWFCNRTKEELEWIATKTNQKLPSLEPQL